MSQAEIVRTLRDIHSRVQSVETHVQSVDTHVQSLDGRVQSLETRVQSVERHVQSVDTRVQSVEQILPTLATKEELKTAIREEGERTRRYVDERLDARIKEDGERTRRHMDMIAERMHDDVRLVAEAQLAADARVERHRTDHLALERRVTHVEDAISARKRRK